MGKSRIQTILMTSRSIQRSSFVWNLFSASINSFQTMLLLIVLTRFGTDADAASFVMAYAAGNLLFNIGKYGVRQFQVTDSIEQYSFRDYAGARWISLTAMAIAIPVFVVTGVLFRSYTVSKAVVVLLICVYKGIEAAEDVFHGRMQQQGRLDVAGRILFIRIFSFIICYAFLFVLSRNILLTTAVATALAAIMAIVLNCSVWDHFRDKKTEPPQIWKLLKACAPLCLTMILNIYLGNAPKYIIDGQVSDALQAKFNIVFMPVFVMSLLGTFIYQPELKSIGEARKDRQFIALRKKVFKLTMITLLATLPVAVVGAFFGIPILEMVYKTSLGFLRTQLILFILSGCLIALSNLYGMVLIAFRHQKTMTATFLFSSIVLFLFGTRVLEAGGIPGLTVFFLAVLTVHTLLLAIGTAYVFAREKHRMG